MKNARRRPQEVFFSEWKASTSWMPIGLYRPRSTSIKGSAMPYTARQEVSADTKQKKTSAVVHRRKITPEPKPLKQTTIFVVNKGEFSQPWANRCFTLTSSMHETEHSNNTLNKRVGWGSETTFSPECTSKCRDDKYKIAKWWRPVSKDRELALYEWMHLNPESRAIKTRKHRIVRVHDIQTYLLDTIQIAVQNEHGNVGDRNTPMRCKRGENICPNHQVLHFSLRPSI
jgi:hypothetical protein